MRRRRFNLLATAVVTGLALFVYHASEGHVRSRTARAFLAGAFLLLPVASIEAFHNAANLHWYLLTTRFWALLWRPERRRQIALATVIVGLAALSSPFAMLLAPIGSL